MMKYNFLLLLTIIISSGGQIISQDSKISVGFGISPTMTGMRKAGFGLDAKFNLSYGINLDYYFEKKFSIKSGLEYETKGAKNDVIFFDDDGQPAGSRVVDYKYDYLVLPLAFSFNTKGNVKFCMDAGTYFGFLLSQHNIYSQVGPYPKIVENGYDKSKKFDSGILLGFGLCIPIGDKLVIDIGNRDYIGLLNINKSNILENLILKTHSLRLQIGLKYKL